MGKFKLFNIMSGIMADITVKLYTPRMSLGCHDFKVVFPSFLCKEERNKIYYVYQNVRAIEMGGLIVVKITLLFSVISFNFNTLIPKILQFNIRLSHLLPLLFDENRYPRKNGLRCGNS